MREPLILRKHLSLVEHHGKLPHRSPLPCGLRSTFEAATSSIGIHFRRYPVLGAVASALHELRELKHLRGRTTHRVGCCLVRCGPAQQTVILIDHR